MGSKKWGPTWGPKWVQHGVKNGDQNGAQNGVQTEVQKWGPKWVPGFWGLPKMVAPRQFCFDTLDGRGPRSARGPSGGHFSALSKMGTKGGFQIMGSNSSAALGSAGPKPKPEPGAWSSSEAEAEAGGDRGAGCRATNALLRISANSAKERAGRNSAVMPWRRQSCDHC